MRMLILMTLLALSITGCSTTHYVALSDDLAKRLTDCQRPAEVPAAWLTCSSEPCRRAKEGPILTDNARKHHACADLVDDVRAHAERVKAQNP